VLIHLRDLGDSPLADVTGWHSARVVKSFRSVLFAALFAIIGLACGAPLIAAQSSPGSGIGGGESPEQIEQAVIRYENFLADPAPGTTQSTMLAVRVRLGTAYFLLHRYPESLKALAAVVGSDPRKSTTPNSAMHSASGSEPNARLMFAQAWLVYGLDHLELNQAADAIAPLRRALDLDPQNANARLALGDALARDNQMQAAEKEYEEQLRLTPSLPDCWYKLGMVHLQLAADWKRVLTEKSGNSILSQQLSAEDMLAGEANWDAARILLRLTKDAPGQPAVHADLGRALLALGYPKTAAHEFRQELALDPEDPSAMLGLAETAVLREGWEDADSELDKLTQSQPRQFAQLVESAPPGPLRQAWNDGLVKMPESIAKTPEGVFWKNWLTTSSLTPDMISSITRQSSACAVASLDTAPGRWLSESCYRRLARTLRDRQQLSSAAKVKLVETLFRLGDYQGAMDQAQSILQSHPNDGWGTYWLSRAHSELAGDCFVKLGLLDPASPRVHQMLAERYLGWGQFSQAVSEYEAAIKLAPSLPDLYLGLGDTYTRMLDWADAVTQYKKTIELAPGSLAAQAELGHAYVRLGEWELAIAQLSQIPADAPQAAAARLDLANAEDQLGETRQAIAELLPFEAQDKDGEIHFRLGVFYRKIGDTDHAKEAMQAFQSLRAAELAVSHSEIQALEDEKESTSSAPSSSN
jgi:tetratricopeptide (TPR) repeat protein